MLPLTTSFGMLRPWRLEDEAALARYVDNRKIWLNMRDGFFQPFSLERVRAFLEKASQQNPVTYCAIATEEEAIGGIGISLNADVHRLTGELGYWLAEPYWGRGIMTESVRLFTADAFERLGLVRIYAEPYVSNPASVQLLEKVGFVCEGRMRASVIKDGRILDQWLYALVQISTG